MVSYIIGGNSLTLFHEGEAYQVSQDNPKWEELVKAIGYEDWDTAIKLANPITALKKYVDGDIRIEGRRLWIGPDEEMHGALAERVLSMHEQGFPIKPMVLFIRNLRMNPSNRAINELYRFLEANELPITSDGHFMAYKRVDVDFKDQRTHTIDNSPGQVVEMPRNEVDDDCSNTCSHGLHFAGRNYINSYSGVKLIAIKIHPKNVVSIPTDYNDSKGRCCRYEVISELDLSDALAGEEVFNTAVYDAPAKATVDQARGLCTVCKQPILITQGYMKFRNGDITHQECHANHAKDDIPAEPADLIGSGAVRCAHCGLLIVKGGKYVLVEHKGIHLHTHKTCKKFFREAIKTCKGCGRKLLSSEADVCAECDLNFQGGY